MLNAQDNELTKETQDCYLNNLEVLDKLEKEAELLNQEKKSLIEMQEQLWLKISVEIENKRQKNQELKQDVEELRSKCDELSKVLNST
jgi:hypothetical protein